MLWGADAVSTVAVYGCHRRESSRSSAPTETLGVDAGPCSARWRRPDARRRTARRTLTRAQPRTCLLASPSSHCPFSSAACCPSLTVCSAQVGSSEAALLTKLGVKPFEYGLRILSVWDGGSVFPPDVLKISEETLMTKWGEALGNVAALSLATNYPTEASLPHMIVNGAKNVVAVALEADYIEFDVVKKIKAILDSAA